MPHQHAEEENSRDSFFDEGFVDHGDVQGFVDHDHGDHSYSLNTDPGACISTLAFMYNFQWTLTHTSKRAS